MFLRLICLSLFTGETELLTSLLYFFYYKSKKTQANKVFFRFGFVYVKKGIPSFRLKCLANAHAQTSGGLPNGRHNDYIL